MISNEHHREAYELIRKNFEECDYLIKFQLAEYLTYGISDYLVPNDKTKWEASQLFLESSYEAHQEIPDQHVPNFCAFKADAYDSYEKARNENDVDGMESAIEKLFEYLTRDIPDPF